MTNIYSNPSLDDSAQTRTGSYDGYQKPDTKIPPKAKPVLNKVCVNGVEIPEATIMAEAQHHPAETPGEALLQATQALVIRELFLQEARNTGIVAHPAPGDNARKETAEDTLIRLLVERDVDVPQANPAECERYYRNNLHKFSSEILYEASHILLAAPSSDKVKREAARQRAEEICNVLKSDASQFEDCAAEFSDCPSREHGGNLGQLAKGSTVEEFEQALEGANEPGLLPEPVASRFGYHIIRVDRRVPGKTLPFEHVRDSIASWMEAKSWSKALSQYVSILAANSEIKGISLHHDSTPLVW